MPKDIEDRMELISAGATGGKEYLLEEWRDGTYHCARCNHPLYESSAKWRGPCPWPSFRKAAVPEDKSVSTNQVLGYNNYTCRVFELYCKKCDLFLGHKFEDAKEKGDTSVDAHWRH